MLQDKRVSFGAAATALACLIAIALALRIHSPSDIDARDQAMTIAYTVDMVANGNLILAADSSGLPATKPPLINYLSAPLVLAFGPHEWAFRMPALIVFFGIVALVYMAARDMFARAPADASMFGLSQAAWAVLLSAGFFCLSNVPMRIAYLSRPDTLLVFGMTLSWYAATRALSAPDKPGLGWPAAFWLGIMIAAWAKGPLALVPIAYAVLAARLLHGGWGQIRVLRPLIGLPLALAVGLAWPAAVYVKDPAHLINVLIGEQLREQFVGRWYSQLLNAVRVPLLTLSRFLPWSLLAILGAFVFPWRQWHSHPIAPALLYLALTTVAMAATTGIRGDRVAPMLPPLAIVCAWVAVYAWADRRLLVASLVSLPLTAAALSLYFQVLSEQAINRHGQNLVNFADVVRAKVAGDPILFCPTDPSTVPIQALLGVNQRGAIFDRAPAQGAWVIAYESPNLPAIVTSGPVSPRPLVLYRARPYSPICQR